jgi:predicted ATPase/DNA-binding SARP family transcriptional activator
MRIGLLGTLTVADDAGRPVRVGGQRVRALLTLLALDTGRVVPAYLLIDRLWGDDDTRPADAANALQSLVSRLRAALRDGGVDPGVIESSPTGYRLAIAPDAVDAIAFETAARAGARFLGSGDAAQAARILRAALATWRGPALADVAGEEFAAAIAARLAEARRAAQLDRVAAVIALGDEATVTGELRAIVTSDPLSERPRELLMRALVAGGRHAEALATYHELRDQLSDQLGVDPSPALEQLYLAILRHDATAVAVGPGLSRGVREAGQEANSGAGSGAGTIGPALNSFVGRDDDASGLLKKLSEHRLVTLIGPGGVGKTRLSAEASPRLGVPAWFAELAPVTDPARVPYAVLSAVGIHERVIARQAADSGDPVDRLTDALAGREAVLVLDNCEHVIDVAASLAARILADCPKVTILATSREPLRITGEVLWPLAPLPVPPEGESEVGHFAAVRLLADRVAAVRPSFAVEAGNAAAVARLCRALDGMPLAIELAAPWLRTLTPHQLAERLDDRFALLTSGSRTALPRHQTLRAVVDWSWELLSGAERALARRLAVFPAGATLAAAEAVCAAEAVSAAGAVSAGEAVLPALDGLVGKSILTLQDGPGGTDGRYRMLETVRAYCLERLAEAGEETAVKDAFACYCLNLAETADAMLRTRDQVRWGHALAAEQDNLHAALRWAIGRGDADTALRFVRSLGYFWVHLGHGEGDALARKTLALPPPPIASLRIAEARVICTLIAAGWSWDVEAVRETLTEALADLQLRSAGSLTIHPLAAMAEPMMGLYDGDEELALSTFERYLTAPDPWMRAMARLYRASYNGTLGRMAGVEEDCRAALEEFRVLGDKWGMAITLAQLAEFTELRGDHRASIAALAQAGVLAQDLGAWGDRPYIVGRLALIRARSGDLAGAWTEWAAAMLAAAALGGLSESGRMLGMMRAEIAWRAGDLPEVTRCCTEVLDGIKDAKATWWQGLRGQVKARQALVAHVTDDPERARQLRHEALIAATGWVERPPLAAVIDAVAAYVATGGPACPVCSPLQRACPGGIRGLSPSEAAEQAAALLGAAHAVRGSFDEGGPEGPSARAAVREVLGTETFETAYERGRAPSRENAVALVTRALTLDR